MLGLMESPLHHFFDGRTDAAALNALVRPIGTRANTKTTVRHQPGDKLLTFLKDIYSS
jgi:hypothetical protein